MNLYKRDFNKCTVEELSQYDIIRKEESTGLKFGRINLYYKYPEAIRHFQSLFPNNHIVLFDYKENGVLSKETTDKVKEFYNLIHNSETKEQQILNFINHSPAYFIIASIFNAAGFQFGHHDAYIFPEFRLGDKYRADYLLIGKGSGGYEFVFIELESPNGRIAIKSGDFGEVIRKGLNQLDDWVRWLPSNQTLFFDYFNKVKGVNIETLPSEFTEFDLSRYHYVVIAGLRQDFDSHEKLRKHKREYFDSNIKLLHYDNLYDSSMELNERNTF